MPDKLGAPQVQVVDVVKHTGQVVVSSERGVRLDVRNRSGLSERHPREAGIKDERSLVFSILKPDWQLELLTEVIDPLIHVDALHVARVADGLIRHAHHVRWRIQHAGTKQLRLGLPTGLVPDRGVGLTVAGPNIADWKTVKDGDRWFVDVELTKKWFDATYPMTVHYETRYESGDWCLFAPSVGRHGGLILTRHHLAVFARDRVEVEVASFDDGLIASDSRTIPNIFGVDGLESAAFSFRSTDSSAAVQMKVLRHGVADLLAAEVQSVDVQSVLASHGGTMSRIGMQLVVGNKRHLAVRLHDSQQIWSATINGRPVHPLAIRNRHRRYCSVESGCCRGSINGSRPRGGWCRVGWRRPSATTAASL